MQAMLNLHGIHGLPLSVSGITHHFTLSKEMADHDRRREAMKRRRSGRGGGEENDNGNEEVGIAGSHERVVREEEKGEGNGDLASVLEDLCCLACTAKAA